MFETPVKKTGVAAEVADPQVTATEIPLVVDEETAKGPEAAAAGESEASVAAGQKGGQDRETNAAFAKLRREADEARRQLAGRDRWVEENFAAQGLHTWDQYQQAVEATKRQQETDARKKRGDGLREAGIDPDLIDDLIKYHPDVQALKQENQLLRNARENENLAKQFNELAAEFPDIKEAGDIDPETWHKFNLARGGMTLLDAYIAAHGKDILAAARGAGEKDAVTRLASKGHLGTEKSGGKGAEEVDVQLDDEKARVYKTFGYDEKKARAVERRRIKEKGGR